LSEGAEAPVRRDAAPDMRMWKAWLVLFAGGVVILLVAGNLLYATALFTRNNRDYCLTCHQWNQPPGMWDLSDLHSPGLACAPCHGALPGGEARCGGFSAHPETVNPRCMGCHPRVMDGGPLDRWVEVVRRDAPSGGEGEAMARWRLEDMMYTWHVRNRVCLCTDCHRSVAHDSRRGHALRNRPRMSDCAACHYHRAKDAYVQMVPLPELRVLPAAGTGEPDA